MELPPIDWNKKIFSTNIRNDMLLLNNPANTKIGQDGQTWRRLKWIEIVVFSENFLAPDSFSKFIFVVCNVWYNAWEVYFLDKKPWFCCFSSNFFVKVKFNRAWGSVIGNISELMQHDERGETTANLVWQPWQRFCLKKPSTKLRIPKNRSFCGRAKNISVKKIPDKLVTRVITPSHLSHAEILPSSSFCHPVA